MIIKDGRIVDDSINLQTVEIEMKGTRLSIIEGYNAFAMCGALNVDIYNSEKMKQRGVICFNATGVHNVIELYHAKINKASSTANKIGIYEGMLVKDAFAILKEKQN